jgi:hypothetical protein
MFEFSRFSLCLSFFGKEGLSEFKTKLAISLGFLCMFALSVVGDVFTGSWITENLAIHSRKAAGLVGIIFAPVLHPSPSSAFIDCAPFFLLSMLVMVRVAATPSGNHSEQPKC